jgi:hypothetical protein
MTHETDTGKTVTPAATATHEPADAHADEGHDREMEGLGGHVDEHMSDDHSHGEPRLGPIDWAAWAYAGLGVAAGLIVVVAFWLAIS